MISGMNLETIYMKQENFLFEGCGGAKLSAVIWTPDDESRMTLQIAHGMTEHMGRYEKLAEALTGLLKESMIAAAAEEG